MAAQPALVETGWFLIQTKMTNDYFQTEQDLKYKE